MLSFILALAVHTVPLSNGPSGTFTVPVSVDGAPAKRFVVDLGAGINTLAPVAQPGEPVFRLTGFRMLGDRLDSTLYRVPSLEIGGVRLTDQTAGYWKGATDFGVAGFLSAKAFEKTPVTLDFPHKTLVFESADSLSERVRNGHAVQLAADDVRGESLQLFADVDFGSGQHGQCLIDTGQFNMQIDKRYMEALNLSAGAPGVVQQDDRFIAHLPRVSLEGAQQVYQNDMKVIFRDHLIYDCVIGNSFWVQNKSVTFDIAHRTMYVTMPNP